MNTTQEDKALRREAVIGFCIALLIGGICDFLF